MKRSDSLPCTSRCCTGRSPSRVLSCTASIAQAPCSSRDDCWPVAGGRWQGKTLETHAALAPAQARLTSPPKSPQSPTYPHVQVGELFQAIVQNKVGVPGEEDALVLASYWHWLQLLHPPDVQARRAHQAREWRATVGGGRINSGQGP